MPVAGQVRSGSATTAAQPLSASGIIEAAGVVVDFTTPILAGSRVRLSDANTLEVILSGIGGSGQYVVPLDHLEKAVTLTVHDRALCGEIMKRNAFTTTAVASTSFVKRRAASRSRVRIASVWPLP